MTSLDTQIGFTEPMTATLADAPPDGDQWLHEIKHDGYRTQIVVQDGQGRAFTRTGLDWSRHYAALVEAALDLRCDSAVIDGEAIVQDARGASDFKALQAELRKAKPRGIVLVAFDLLLIDGEDLRRRPIEERRHRLAELLARRSRGSPLHFSDHVVGGGREFFDAAEAIGLEGIVSKKLGSPYRSGRTKSWLKTKAFTQGEYVVVGTSKGDPIPIALLARETEDHRLEYAGPAWVTLAGDERERFWRANERLKTERPALHMEARPQTSWLKPDMRVIVRHLAGEDPLRHATVQSIVSLPEPPSAPGSSPALSGRKRNGPTKEPARLAEHGAVPDREKLVGYYRSVAPLMLPHLSKRPLNLLRCHGRYCFFQRNRTHPQTDATFDAPIRNVPIAQKNGRTEDYLYIDDEAGLIACVEAETIEFHAWGSRVPDFERPDRIAFDLDPGEGVTFEAVKSAALQMRRSLAAIGLESWPLLTGGKGIHVILPFAPEVEWPRARGFARMLCAALAAAAPELYTIALPKAERSGRIFLDFLRNQRTATAIMPYSVRARPGSPVAAPVAWEELEAIDSAAAFAISDAPALAKRAKFRNLRGWGVSDQRLPLE